MSVQEKLIAKYGNPMADRAGFEARWMTLAVYPADIATQIPCLGKSVYCHKEAQEPWMRLLRRWIQRGLHREINTNDQCFMPRYIRGLENKKVISIHSWGLAFDLNMGDNPLGLSRLDALKAGLNPFTEIFIQTARDEGFVAGADFSRKDLMHFEAVTKSYY